MAYKIVLPGQEPAPEKGLKEQLLESPLVNYPLRAGARAYETARGLPGTIAETGLGLLNLLGEATTGKKDLLPSKVEIPGSFLLGAPGAAYEGARKLLGAFTDKGLPELPSIPVKNIQEVKEEETGKILPTRVMEPGKNVAERFIDRIGGEIPFLLSSAFTGGASLAPMITRSLGANVTAQALEEMGASPAIQFVGGLAGGLGSEYLRSKGAQALQGVTQAGKPTGKSILGEPGAFSAQNIGSYLRKKQNELYEKVVKPFAKDKTIPSAEAEKGFDDLLNKIVSPASGLDRAARRKVERELIDSSGVFKSGKVNLAEAVDQVQHINGLIRGETNPSINRYYEQANKHLQSLIEKAEQVYPEWGEAHKSAKNITKVLNTAQEAAERSKDFAQVLKGGPLKTLFSSANWLLGDFAPSKEIRYLWQVPEAREYFKNTFLGVLNNDKALAVRNMKGLEKILSKGTPQGKYKIILTSQTQQKEHEI